MLVLDDNFEDAKQRKLVNEFFNNINVKKYVLARNVYAESLSKFVEIDGYVDDFTDATQWRGKPIIKCSNVDQNSITISCSLAIYPHTAMKSLNDQGGGC